MSKEKKEYIWFTYAISIQSSSFRHLPMSAALLLTLKKKLHEDYHQKYQQESYC